MIQQSARVVETAGLCKTFKDFWRRPRVHAVRDLNLEIAPGEVFGLLGPNGSGKTTTIKLLLGLLYPTHGRVSVFGRPPTDVMVKSRIGFMPEESCLYRFLVAHETLDYYGRLFRLPSRVRRERTERLLDMVGLRHEAKRPIGEYSKGMARRIGLAQALINDPEFLILDEPTSGMDPIGARQIKDLIRALGDKGKTILLSSHILADVEDVCDRVTILYGGQQQAVGDIDELLRKRDTTQITTESLSEETIDATRALLLRLEKKDILDVSHPRVRLEDFFLRVVEEAQAANIRTSGARRSGEVPEFLRKATQSPTEEIVESLVSAASHGTQPVEPAMIPVSITEESISKEVIETLLSTGRHEADMEPEAATRGPSASRKQPEPTAPPVGDERVIQSLIDGDRRESDKSVEDAS